MTKANWLLMTGSSQPQGLSLPLPDDPPSMFEGEEFLSSSQARTSSKSTVLVLAKNHKPFSLVDRIVQVRGQQLS